MRQVVLALLLMVALARRASADGLSLDPRLTEGDFGNLAEAVADAIAFPNLGPAAPSGLTGFEVLAAAGGPRVDTGERWWRYAVDSRTYGGVWSGVRLIARKGLPWNLDVGAQIGQLAGERFLGGEARWALLESGVLSPALALRASYSRLEDAPLAVEVKEAQLVLSKAFTLLTPYAAAGYRRVEANAKFGEPTPIQHSVRSDRTITAAGVRVSLVPFHFVGEVRQGSKLGFFVGVGVGL